MSVASCAGRGDICQLSVDAIVNAANEAGLGCFAPSHRCIDNVIHRRAGPALRNACREAMAKRPASLAQLSAGTVPLVTPGFALPSRFVLHVTGPAISPRGRDPTEEEERSLASCYTVCLDAARDHGLRSIAFCCISTGLFGYPPKQAANVALRAVCNWITTNADVVDFVVFDTFLEADFALYTELVARSGMRCPS